MNNGNKIIGKEFELILQRKQLAALFKGNFSSNSKTSN